MRKLLLILLCVPLIGLGQRMNDDFRGKIKSVYDSYTNSTTKYDKFGNKTEIWTLTDTIRFSYNDKGDLVSRDYTGGMSYLGTTNIVLEYDSLGNKIREKHYNDGNYYGMIEYEYDKFGRMIKKTPDKQYGGRIIEYKYDKNGKKTLQNWIGDDGKIYRYFKYSYNGNFQKDIVYNIEGVKIEEFNYELNEYDDCISQEMWFAATNKKSITTYEYKYDKHGNYIERKIYTNRELFSSKTREIEYYE